MARIGIWIPCEGRHVARSVAKELRHSFEEVHVIRLRDRTGPSAEKKADAAMAEIMSILSSLTAHDQHLARLEAEHAALVQRVSDLEGPPVASPPATTEPTPPPPTREQIEAYLRASPAWEDRTATGLPVDRDWWDRRSGGCGLRLNNASDLSEILLWIANAESVTPAEMRARILGAGKAAVEPTDDELLALYVPVFQTKCERDEHPLAHVAGLRALYTLGRERGSSDRAALLTHERPEEAEDRLAKAGVATPEPTEAEMAAELEAAGWIDCTTGWSDTNGDAHGLSLDRAYAAMRAAKGELARMLATRPTAPTPIAHVPTESAGADGARLVLSEAEMAAELREAGWRRGDVRRDWRAPNGAVYRFTDEAHAAMRAAKEAK